MSATPRTDAASHAALLAFARDILRESRGDCGPGDVGGDFIQESALKHGLLATKTVVAPCCGNCACAEVCEFPVQCHFETELVKTPAIKCPHCGDSLLWSEDRGAHCDGCEEFDPEKDLPSNP